MTPPTLACQDLRVDVDRAPAVDGLSFSTKGARVLVLGGPRELFLATGGVLAVVRGTLRVLGAEPVEAVKARTLATGGHDPPLPDAWTVHEYVTWSARLAGLSKSDARARATEALARLDAGTQEKTKIARANGSLRRATSIAAALATDAKVVALDDPLGGLAEEDAVAVGDRLVRALEGRAWIVFAPRVPIMSPLARAADEALVVTASTLDAQGTPSAVAAAAMRFRVRAHGPVDELVRRLEERGARAHVDGAQIAVDLAGALTTSQLLGLCAETQVSVVELVPVARALA